MEGQETRSRVGRLLPPPMALMVPLLLSGCFAGLLDEHSDAKVGLICAFLGPAGPDLAIQEWGDPVQGASAGAARTLSGIASRPVTVRSHHPAPELERNDMEAYRSWADGQDFRVRGEILLHILWVDTLPSPDATGAEIGVGAVVLSRSAVERGAERLGVPASDVGEAVALHHLGHALGVVNRGVPVQNPAIQEREGTPGHATDPATVMHHGWEDVRNMTWHGEPDYSADDRNDWSAAQAGVCA